MIEQHDRGDHTLVIDRTGKKPVAYRVPKGQPLKARKQVPPKPIVQKRGGTCKYLGEATGTAVKLKCRSKGHGMKMAYQCLHPDVEQLRCIPSYLGPWGRNQKHESALYALCKRCLLKEDGFVNPP